MISEKKKADLTARMESLGVFERDLTEHFVRSGGHGGQNVNKVSTCVYLRHGPTGLEVKCQQTRSQVDNRYLARRILCDKIEAQIRGRESAKAREIYRKKKQKQKRSKRAKEKMLAAKRARSEIKSLRKGPDY